MPLFGKKADPISARSKALNREIADLEAKIRKLNAEPPPTPKPRAVRPADFPAASAAEEPVFESVPKKPGPMPATRPEDAAHFNEMGLRKFDLVSLFAKIQAQFQGKPTQNPKLIQLIASGNIHGLRPLRYEKRVARNRFILVLTVLILVVWGIVAMLR
jgi:hypothetical protein